VTTKDDLHALVDELDELEARDLLSFLRARNELSRNVSQAYIQEHEAAYDEAFSPRAVRLPHDGIRKWLLAWGTPDEAAADQQLEALEQQLTNEARDIPSS
jgi:hypothetical protein